jgi:hypothetical protein
MPLDQLGRAVIFDKPERVDAEAILDLRLEMDSRSSQPGKRTIWR